MVLDLHTCTHNVLFEYWTQPEINRSRRVVDQRKTFTMVKFARRTHYMLEDFGNNLTLRLIYILNSIYFFFNYFFWYCFLQAIESGWTRSNRTSYPKEIPHHNYPSRINHILLSRHVPRGVEKIELPNDELPSSSSSLQRLEEEKGENEVSTCISPRLMISIFGTHPSARRGKSLNISHHRWSWVFLRDFFFFQCW